MHQHDARSPSDPISSSGEKHGEAVGGPAHGSEDRSSAVIAALLNVTVGGANSSKQLLQQVYDELRALARARMAREPAGHTLQPTALVHEAYLRLAGNGDVRWNDKNHFFAAAALAMRRILIERARKSNRRPKSPQDVCLGAMSMSGIDWIDAIEHPDELLCLDEAIKQLARVDLQTAKIVELKFFAGLTNEATAEVLGVNLYTVHRDWSYAKTWLYNYLQRKALHG